MRIRIDVLDSSGIERACASNDCMNLISSVKQEFCEIGSVLASYAR
jgi:hypothetical protein